MKFCQKPPFRKRQFAAEIIVTCVRWYLRFSLSLRDVEELMAERGLSVDHRAMHPCQCFGGIAPNHFWKPGPPGLQGQMPSLEVATLPCIYMPGFVPEYPEQEALEWQRNRLGEA